MSTNLLQIGIPLWDASNETVDFAPFQATLEALDLNHQTAYTSLYRFVEGAYWDECRVFEYEIADADLATAISDVTTFIHTLAFFHPPYYRVIVLSQAADIVPAA